MTLEQIKEFIIPGYLCLSEAEQHRFEITQAGALFLEFAELITQAQAKLNEANGGLFSTLKGVYQWLFTYPQEVVNSFINEFTPWKNKFLNDVESSQDYKTIKTKIALVMLNQCNITFKKAYTDAEITQLCNSKHIQELLLAIFEVEQNIKICKSQPQELPDYFGTDHTSELENLTATKSLLEERLLDTWELDHSMLLDEEMQKLEKEIEQAERRKSAKREKQLSAFVPSYFLETLKSIDKLREKNPARKWDDYTLPPNLINNFARLLRFHLNFVSEQEIKFTDLKSFNEHESMHLAEIILNSYKQDKEHFDVLQCFNTYQKHLLTELENRITNPKKITQTKETSLTDSLSFLWRNKAVDTTGNFIKRWADAHAFMQATSLASQGENWLSFILDTYNTVRFEGTISSTKSFVSSILNPFTPLAREYNDIVEFEKNTAWKFIRILIPILIIVACIILITTFLTPLALPELVLIAAFIPEILIGLGMASLYVNFKNDAYQYFREIYYGGAYEIPEFQINNKITEAFGEDDAAAVREFYIKEIELCDELEKNYKTQFDKGSLRSTDIKKREENILKRHQLCLEWYDIHSNATLGLDERQQIVRKTLNLNIQEETQALQAAYDQDLPEIKKSITAVTNDITKPLVKFMDIHQNKAFSNDAVTINYTPGLFKPPSCLKHYQKISSMADITSKLQP